jgi:hypothetical protein
MRHLNLIWIIIISTLIFVLPLLIAYLVPLILAVVKYIFP